MREFISDFLAYSKSERRGLILIFFLIVLTLAIRVIMPYWIEPPPGYTWVPAQYGVVEEDPDTVHQKPPPKYYHERRFFDFDPNTLNTDGWVQLGFSPKQAQSIVNYRKSGATFEVKADLLKLFVVDSVRYETLRPHILLPDSVGTAPQLQDTRVEQYQIPEEHPPMEINSADTIALVSLRGVGPYYARQIDAYRHELGGYVNREQLLEIWNMRQETYEMLLPQIAIDSTLIRKIEINDISGDSLRKHPYVSYALARSLIALREKHGRFNSMSDIERSAILTDSISRKLRSYLDFK